MNRNSKKPQPTRATRGNYRRRMIMFRNTSAIRTVCFVTCATLLLSGAAVAQETSPEVRRITLHEAKAKAAELRHQQCRPTPDQRGEISPSGGTSRLFP